MKFKLLFLGLLISFSGLLAQEIDTIIPVYRAEREKINDLVHTKLDVSFDFEKRELNGEAWITLSPHFYEVNELELDAKAMVIHEVKMDNKPLKYEYDGHLMTIQLNRIYKRSEEYLIYIKYTARPEEVTQKGSAAITDAKGLYFVNHDGSDPKKPTQIWTQGETEASSCWFPTIDSPNQKTSQEIYMTVPDKYVTLSNGLLEKQTKNSDGTRTDYWKFDQKHAPYLFFMGVGEFSIVKDTWKDLAVDYYVEEDYEPYAKGIFGDTPEMMDFFSEYTGLEYMWPKYAQFVGRDYVSGAMENTTAVIHGEQAYQTDKELKDENSFESTIAHELFHHWFGDYVTTESWSNLTVNESFANYSEYLWFEYKYGKDRADAHRHKEIDGYLQGGNELKDLVRFHYNSREDMFDAVSYNKGGAILHMLRHYLGDEAFREGIRTYLEENQYGTGEAHQLRLALEKVSGRDLNVFFNQWYYSNGHPKLEVKYSYDDQARKVTVQIDQTQANLFQFPLAIEVYEGEQVKRHEVWVDRKSKSFSFDYSQRPDLVDFDAERTLLAEFSDNKTVENLIHLYAHGKTYEARREAIEGLEAHQNNEEAFKTMLAALDDSYFGLRRLAIEKIDLSNKKAKTALKKLEKMATSDQKTLVRAQAISKLDETGADYKSLYQAALNEGSSAMTGAALKALYKLDSEAAMNFALSIDSEMDKESLKQALVPIFIIDKTESEIAYVADNLIEGMFFTTDKEVQNTYKEGFQWVAATDNEEATRNLVSNFVDLGNRFKQYGADKVAIQVLEQVKAAKSALGTSNQEVLVNIVQQGLNELQ